MKPHSGQTRRWNLFARELEDRLREHGRVYTLNLKGANNSL